MDLSKCVAELRSGRCLTALVHHFAWADSDAGEAKTSGFEVGLLEVTSALHYSFALYQPPSPTTVPARFSRNKGCFRKASVNQGQLG